MRGMGQNIAPSRVRRSFEALRSSFDSRLSTAIRKFAREIHPLIWRAFADATSPNTRDHKPTVSATDTWSDTTPSPWPRARAAADKEPHRSAGTPSALLIPWELLEGLLCLCCINLLKNAFYVLAKPGETSHKIHHCGNGVVAPLVSEKQEKGERDILIYGSRRISECPPFSCAQLFDDSRLQMRRHIRLDSPQRVEDTADHPWPPGSLVAFPTPSSRRLLCRPTPVMPAGAAGC